MSRPELRLDVDYGASPLWTDEGSTPIESFSLSPRLSEELHRWATEFDATTPQGRRMKRGGYVPSDWLDRGRRLARQLQAEVGDAYLVVYGRDRAAALEDEAGYGSQEEER
ncbi:hypothetical protein [Knoellia sp. LjRoot47]|uniref:hypothetical protein n=1 Tax=Knoellia sp. LjRoot47 TaxID=3342330 RepID=UPI003ECE82A7